MRIFDGFFDCASPVDDGSWSDVYLGETYGREFPELDNRTSLW